VRPTLGTLACAELDEEANRLEASARGNGRRSVTFPMENLRQVQHTRLEGRGSACFAQMGDEHFGGCLVSEAFAWLRIQVMGEVDELLLRDVG
jgi:hypothetical protein